MDAISYIGSIVGVLSFVIVVLSILWKARKSQQKKDLAVANLTNIQAEKTKMEATMISSEINGVKIPAKQMKTINDAYEQVLKSHISLVESLEKRLKETDYQLKEFYDENKKLRMENVELLVYKQMTESLNEKVRYLETIIEKCRIELKKESD